MQFRKIIIGLGAIWLGVFLGKWMIGDNLGANVLGPVGEPVTVAWVEIEDSVQYVPIEVFISDPEKGKLFIVKQGIADKIEVEVGEITEERVEVVSGLEGYETLVIEGQDNLKDGDQVRSVVQI